MRLFYILLVALFIVGCDGTSHSHQATAPKDFHTLVRNNTDEPESIDPQKIESLYADNIVSDLFEGLVNVNNNGEAIPGVATKWETTDGLRYTFHLREDAKWSDGKKVTAHDFVYAWQRAVDPKTASKYAWYVAAIGILNAHDITEGKLEPSKLGVKAIDDHTLLVILDAPKGFFPITLVRPTLYPAPKHAIEKYGDTWTQPGHMVSNGAYQLKNWIVHEEIKLSRNPHYWDNANTHIDNVVFLPIKSRANVLKRYLANEVHMTYQIPLNQFQHLKEKRPDEVKVSPQLSLEYYSINMRKAPFNDVRVRQALSYAIDRDKLVKLVLGQGQLPAYTVIPEVAPKFHVKLPEWGSWEQAKREQEAQALLLQAGFDKKHKLKFSLFYNTSDVNKKTAIAIASMWKDVLGVKVELVNQEWKTYLATKQAGQFDIAREGWMADYMEGGNMMEILRSNSAINSSGFNDKAFDALLELSNRTINPKMRETLLHQAEDIVDKTNPIIPIYQSVTFRLVKPYLKGYSPNPMDRVYSKDLYFETVKQHD